MGKQAEKISSNSVTEQKDLIEPYETKSINCAVVIPSLNPIPELYEFVQKLFKRGVPKVIVVNDGSNDSYNSIFTKLEELEHCVVLTHEVNRGKGRALKTAFSYFLEQFSHLDGVVTADADGQHSIDDICKICNLLSQNDNVLILGVRNFKESNVPRRSYLGNMLTTNIFHLLYGYKLSDTQTGLRGIPARQIKNFIDLKGERYDFEINMLIKAKSMNLGLITVPIETLYFDNNSGSHYNTIKDSAFIFARLITGVVERTFQTITYKISKQALRNVGHKDNRSKG